mgnify:CR=1 FL=1
MKKNLDPDEMPKWLSSLWETNINDLVKAGINDDDCAILKLSDDLDLVITTDFLNSSPIGIELGISEPFNIGRLIVGSNISDLCGTGAEPIAFLLGLMLKKGSSVDKYKEIVLGVKHELDNLNIPLVGGDSKLGKENSFYGIALGISSAQRKLYTKNGAKPGDIIWVSGACGSVGAAVYGLSNKLMNIEWDNWAKSRINEPVLPIVKSKFVAEAKIGNGGTDVSDGLGSDLKSISDASNVGIVINCDSIPIEDEVKLLAEKMNIPAWFFSFSIGGDFQFVVTTESCCQEQMVDMGFYNIGYTTNADNSYIVHNGKRRIMPILGHRDLRKVSFGDEVNSLLKDLNNNLKEDDK